MDNRNLGITVLVLAVLLFGVVANFIQKTTITGSRSGCNEKKECQSVISALNYSHLVIGIIFALFSLGIYLLVFNRSEHALLEKLEKEKDHLLKEDRLKIISMMLDQNEQKVFEAIHEKEGITQTMIRLKTDLSKGTVSQILAHFERKNIIKREPQGKTYSVYLVKEI